MSNALKYLKKDPQGYYIIVANKSAESIVKDLKDVIFEDYGNLVIIKTKSRRLAHLIINKLCKLGLLTT